MENELIKVSNENQIFSNSKYSREEIEKAIMKFGLVNFPIPEELNEHIVDLAHMEDILSLVNNEIQNVEKAIEEFEKTVSELSGGLRSSKKNIGKMAGKLTSTFGGDKDIGAGAGEFVTEAASVLVDLVGGVMASSKRKKLEEKKQENEKRLLKERKNFADEKLPQIKSLLPIFEKNKFLLLYQTELNKQYSLNDNFLEKKETTFKMSLFLYAKAEYLKNLANFFVKTFEAWSAKNNIGLKRTKAPSFNTNLDLITSEWKIIKNLKLVKVDDKVPVYMITALKDPYITSRLLKTDEDDARIPKINVNELLENGDVSGIPVTAKKLLQENPVCKEIERVDKPKKPSAFSVGEFFISIIVFAVFSLATFAQIHYLGNSAFVTLPLIGIAFCCFVCTYSFVLPLTTREEEYEVKTKEYYKTIKKIINNQSFKI